MEDQGSSPSSSTVPLDSPSTSTLLRSGETLEELSRKLGEIKDETEGDGLARCCCGAVLGDDEVSCKMGKERQGMEDKLKLSGEIGNALLQRCELLEQKYSAETGRYQQHIEVKRTALAESVKRVRNVEKANTTHMQKYAEMSRKMEVVEKRYAEAMHNQTLTHQSLTHVRSELTTLKATNARQTIALASRGGVEEKLLEAEKRYEDARDLAEEEGRKSRDERRKRQRAELRIAELEEQLKVAGQEVDRVKEVRATDAQDLLSNAKERLHQLHNELSETYHGKPPEEVPEYQRILEELVANNTLLKHDAGELSQSLFEARDEVRVLRDEVESLRKSISGGGSRLLSPIEHQYPRLAHELSPRFAHSRTESSPIMGGGWRQPRVSAWEHHRKQSTGAAGLGMGPIGEVEIGEGGQGGEMVEEPSSSSPVAESVESPKLRASPGVGIGYMVNGVPVRPSASRRFSADSRTMRNYAARTIGSIDETTSLPDETPRSPGSDYFRAAEISRKRRSLRLSRQSPMSPNGILDYSPSARNAFDPSNSTDLPSPMSMTEPVAVEDLNSQKLGSRRTLLLLSKSKGVQTDPVPEKSEKQDDTRPSRANATTSSMGGTSRGTSPTHTSESISSNPNVEDGPASSLLVVVEHMSRILAKLRAADVPTLNKRLKKHNLPGDVMHLSQSTLRALQQEIGDIRHQFKGVHHLGMIDPRDFTLLLRLMKDVFNDLVELQAVVNDVTITPAVAKKLQRAAYKAEEDDSAKSANVTSSLGWIAAPITKFFVTPADNPENESASGSTSPAVAGLERGKSSVMPKRAAPKQQAISGPTATHVSVEFGGAGMVRRVAPAMATPGSGSGTVSELSSPVSDQRTVSSPAVIGTLTKTDGGLAPPNTVRTLRSVKSRANRNDLLGLFAGAAPRTATPREDSWAIDRGAKREGKASGEHTIRQAGIIGQRKALSSAVDAVIDQSTVEGDDDVALSGSYDPPLLERQLRPRGLSDSSIRSTTISTAKESTREVVSGGSSARAPAYGATPSGPSVFQTLSRRFYNFRAPEPEMPDEPEQGDGDTAETTRSSDSLKTSPIRPPVINTQRPSPSHPIMSPPAEKAQAPRVSSRTSSISTNTSFSTRETRDPAMTPTSSRHTASSPVLVTGSQNTTSQPGFFGYISSLVGEGDDGEGEDDEFVGANMRQGGMLGHARVDSAKVRRNV